MRVSRAELSSRSAATLAAGALALSLCGCAGAADGEPSAASSAGSSPGTATTQDSTGADQGDPDAERSGTRRTALFFGDSYFIGGGCSPDATRDMAAVAGRALGYRPVVRGGGGTGFVSANPDYDLPDYLGQIRDGALEAARPALVVVEGGTNDLGQPAGRIARNAALVLREAQRRHPSATLVLMGVLDNRPGYADSRPVRDLLRRVARQRGVGFVDPLLWTRGRPGLICSDADHPTYAGHRVLARKLIRALTRLGA